MNLEMLIIIVDLFSGQIWTPLYERWAETQLLFFYVFKIFTCSSVFNPDGFTN